MEEIINHFLDSISFDTTGLIPQGQKNGVRVWQTPDGDGVGLYLFPVPPDILADINSLESLSSFYGNQLAAASVTGILIDTIDIDGCRFIKMVVRVPQQPLGMSYLGSLTLPFRDFSFVIKMQCAERGVTGMRESLIADELLSKGEIKIAKSGKFDGWEQDLSSNTSLPWKINRAEAPEYDILFPTHPLSILRRTLAQIESSIRITSDMKLEPKFTFPNNAG